MSDNTNIEWCDSTWSPLRGCSRISPGCVNCYAERMCARGLPGLKSPSTGADFAIMTPSGPRWTGEVELIEDALAVPLGWRKPRRVFVNSMSDTFHEKVSDSTVDKIFSVIASCQRHAFMVLTKRARRMKAYVSQFEPDGNGFVTRKGACFDRAGMVSSPERWPLKNLWLGVSVESRQQLGRVDDLRATPAALRFLSLEPLLEDLGPLDLTGIGWVIVGGESGPDSRICRPDWIASIVEQCAAAGVPCFVKQLGSYAVLDARYERILSGPFRKLRHPKGGDIEEWPHLIRVRQIPEQNGGPTR